MRASRRGASFACHERSAQLPMLRFLFPRLTPAPERGIALFAAVTAKAREPHWYVEGEVPDTLDGRFRVLATLAALVVVRLEQAGDDGEAASVSLTERFIEVMESEHRELGLGDPALGRTVRKLVGSLARRVGIWKAAMNGSGDWDAAARDCLYKAEIAEVALAHSSSRLHSFWDRLQAADVEDIAEGQWG